MGHDADKTSDDWYRKYNSLSSGAPQSDNNHYYYGAKSRRDKAKFYRRVSLALLLSAPLIYLFHVYDVASYDDSETKISFCAERTYVSLHVTVPLPDQIQKPNFK